MRKLILLMFAVSAAAQNRPLINPDGVVRDDGKHGFLAPGMIISIYGRNLGTQTICRENCGVQVFLDNRPLEVQSVHEVQINAKIPDSFPIQPSLTLSLLVHGQPGNTVTVRMAPDPATISLEGTARVDGPIWIHIDVSGKPVRVAYPPLGNPSDFSCDAFEVRRNGSVIAPLQMPRFGGAAPGPSCPGFSYMGRTAVHPGSLPLHMQFRLETPAVYEVRYSHYNSFSRGPNSALIYQSAWTPIQVLAAVARPVPTARPQDPVEILSSFLPDLLAKRDDFALSVLLEYIYHPASTVRNWAGNALYYWPESAVRPKLEEALFKVGPTSAIGMRVKQYAAALAEKAPMYFSYDNPVLADGAVAILSSALSDADPPLDPKSRRTIEQFLIATAQDPPYIPYRLGGQATNDFVALFGSVQDPRAREVLWSYVDHNIHADQALGMITWKKDPSDLPRIVATLIAARADAPAGRDFQSLPNSMIYAYGAPAVQEMLRTVMQKAGAPQIRVTCAEELVRLNDAAAWDFAIDAVSENRQWKRDLMSRLANQFPELRNTPDTKVLDFLNARRAR